MTHTFWVFSQFIGEEILFKLAKLMHRKSRIDMSKKEIFIEMDLASLGCPPAIFILPEASIFKGTTCFLFQSHNNL